MKYICMRESWVPQEKTWPTNTASVWSHPGKFEFLLLQISNILQILWFCDFRPSFFLKFFFYYIWVWRKVKNYFCVPLKEKYILLIVDLQEKSTIMIKVNWKGEVELWQFELLALTNFNRSLGSFKCNQIGFASSNIKQIEYHVVKLQMIRYAVTLLWLLEHLRC